MWRRYRKATSSSDRDGCSVRRGRREKRTHVGHASNNQSSWSVLFPKGLSGAAGLDGDLFVLLASVCPRVCTENIRAHLHGEMMHLRKWERIEIFKLACTSPSATDVRCTSRAGVADEDDDDSAASSMLLAHFRHSSDIAACTYHVCSMFPISLLTPSGSPHELHATLKNNFVLTFSTIIEWLEKSPSLRKLD